MFSVISLCVIAAIYERTITHQCASMFLSTNADQFALCNISDVTGMGLQRNFLNYNKNLVMHFETKFTLEIY